MINYYFEEVEEFTNDIPSNNSQWIAKCIDLQGFNLLEISIIFCSDDYLLEINKTHLNHNYYTDIITFNYNEDRQIEGDLFISIDRVKENAKENGVEFMNELQRVMIHGVLHLCGQNDKTEEEQAEMTRKENLMLDELKTFHVKHNG